MNQLVLCGPTRLFEKRLGKRAPRAFTLVELLVVIGIIALLIAILLPTLSSARNSAKGIACLSNIRQIGQSTTFFVNDHNLWTPKGWWNNGPTDEYAPKDGWNNDRNPPWEWVGPMWGWDTVLLKYAETKDIFRCPGDPSDKFRGEFDDNDNPASHPDGNTGEGFKLDNIPASYGYNSSNNPSLWHSYKVTQVPNASKSILLFEKSEESTIHHLATWWGANAADIAAVEPDFPDNLARHRHGSDRGQGRNSVEGDYKDRKLNYLFLDGHGEAVRWETTWESVSASVKVDGEPQQSTMWRSRFPQIPKSYNHGGFWANNVGKVLPNSDRYDGGELRP